MRIAPPDGVYFAGGLEQSELRENRKAIRGETRLGRSAEDPDKYMLRVQRLQSGECEMNIRLQMVISLEEELRRAARSPPFVSLLIRQGLISS